MAAATRLKSIKDIPALPRFFILTQRKNLVEGLMKAGLEHNRMFMMKLGPLNSLVATHPEIAHNILSRPNEFPKLGVQPKSISDPLYNDDKGNPQHLVGVNGSKWTRMRKLMNPAFTKDALNLMLPKFVEETQSVRTLFDEKCLDKDNKVDMRKVMSCFAMDILGSAVLGRKFHAVEGKFSETVSQYDLVMQASSDPLYTFLPMLEKLPLARNRKLTEAVAYMKNFLSKCVDERIQEHKNSPNSTSRPRNDFLDFVLPDPTEKNPEMCLSAEELLPSLWVFFLAGHDTTGISLAWLFLTFAERQDLQDKAREEALRVVGMSGNVEPEHLDHIPFISAVINENLRLNPPVYNVPTRVVEKDTELDGYLVPKGTLISIHIGAINRNPLVWPNPQEFDPNRFLDNQRARGTNYMPFSAGPRRCIGDRFSLMEQKVLLLQVLTRYRILPHQNVSAISNASMPLIFRQPETAFVHLQRL